MFLDIGEFLFIFVLMLAALSPEEWLLGLVGPAGCTEDFSGASYSHERCGVFVAVTSMLKWP